jgi:hypothetical protein
MNTPTYKQCATRFALWAEYVDPSAQYTEAEFDEMPVEEKLAIQVDAFGPERWTCAECGLDYEPAADADPDNDMLCDDCTQEPA